MIENADAADRTRSTHLRDRDAPFPWSGPFVDGERETQDRRTDEERERTIRAYEATVAFWGADGLPVSVPYAYDEDYLGPDHDDDELEERVTTETLFADSVARTGGFLSLGGMATEDAVNRCRAEMAKVADVLVERVRVRFNGVVPEGYELVARVEVRRAGA